VTRPFGEDGGVLAAAGLDLAELEGLERGLVEGLELPAPAGGAFDAHCHLGRDADGHRLGADELLADLDRFGLRRAVCFPLNDPGPDGQFMAANAGVLAAARRSGGRLVPFCRVDPTGDWEPAVRRAADGGARGLKLHPVAQRFALDAPGVAGCAREAAARGWPVVIHAGYMARPIGGPVDALLRAVPDVRLILAHGGRGDARAVAAVARASGQVMLDTSLAALPDLVELPASRLCFGSDRPYGDHATALHLVARAAEVAGWGERELTGIMGDNLSGWLP